MYWTLGIWIAGHLLIGAIVTSVLCVSSPLIIRCTLLAWGVRKREDIPSDRGYVLCALLTSGSGLGVSYIPYRQVIVLTTLLWPVSLIMLLLWLVATPCVLAVRGCQYLWSVLK